jgi:hypothetical protein
MKIGTVREFPHIRRNAQPCVASTLRPENRFVSGTPVLCQGPGQKEPATQLFLV